MRQALFLIGSLILFCEPVSAWAQSEKEIQYETERDLLYRDEESATAAMRERCRLDLYYPKGVEGFPTVVWFHGGGLTSGEKSIPEGLQRAGFAIAAANYRLSPQSPSPAYVEDAAAAVAWVFKNVERYGGSRDKIFVAGHSAGGYLSLMIGLDKQWLAAHEVDADKIAGLIPYSGQVITHFTIRKERGVPETRPIIDAMAPLYHVRADAPPILLLTGDREQELLGRYEETAYLWRMMKVVGHSRVELIELKGYDHGGMAEPGHARALEFIRGELADR